ncbi:MAG: GNAT family N-acetyltransferase, partial [Gammaproteobacteria bacterium]|nr:GNAT family N-acetyltransferase [Gammaproteobacteria bacterium]
MSLEIKELTIFEFSKMEEEWQALLGKSSSDPLFLSWAWQYFWWQTWGDKLNLQLLLLGVYDDELLVGIAPLYVAPFNFGALRGFKRLQFIGNAWRLSDT